MALSDHFRELRARLMRSFFVIAIAFCLGLVFYNHLLDVVVGPYRSAVHQLDQKVQSNLTVNGVGGPLMIQLKLCALAAVLATCPYWLYQIWAFLLPGLRPVERKWTRIFVAVASPLFLGGVALGYLILPKGIAVLIGFTHDNMVNLVDFDHFLAFFTQTLLIFGFSFEIPLFVVLLNAAGLVRGSTLARYRPWIVLSTFVFAAIATPQTDPFSMCFLAAPMVVLFMVSEVIARIVDRRRDRNKAEAALNVDQAAPLPESPKIDR